VLSETIPLKTVCLLGCNQDEMDAEFLRKIDLVIPLQTSSADLISRLKATLDKA
jgi:hypothetical protein